MVNDLLYRLSDVFCRMYYVNSLVNGEFAIQNKPLLHHKNARFVLDTDL